MSQSATPAQGTTGGSSRPRKSRKQDPLWSELFGEIIKAGPNAKRRLANKQYVAVNDQLCEVAAGILKRPPQMSDIDEDLMLVVVRRLHRGCVHAGMVRDRIARLIALSEYATQRFNHPPIDFDDMPLARRITIKQIDKGIKDVEIPPSDTMPEGFDQSMIDLSLDKLLGEYIREKLIGKSADSSRLMRAAVQSFSRYLGRTAVLGDLRKHVVLDYMAQKLDSGLSAASVQSYRERLVSLWAFAFRKRWLPDFPDIPRIKATERTPEAWTPRELGSLLSAAKAADGMFGYVPTRTYFTALLFFIYDTGERIGAARRIRFDDMKTDDTGATWVTIRGELRKGRTRDKAFKLRPVTTAAIAEIKAAMDKGQTMPFETPLSQNYVYKLLDKILEAAGLPTDRRSKFHKIRRTVASEFEAAGGNATELLDHDSRRTTKRSYLDPKVIKSIQPADIVAGIGENRPPAIAAPPDESALLEKLRKMLANS